MGAGTDRGCERHLGVGMAKAVVAGGRGLRQFYKQTTDRWHKCGKSSL